MAIETYIISDKATKKIIERGHVNRERDQAWIDKGDTTTVLGSVQSKLNGNPGFQVVYLPDGPLPDKKIQKINSANTKAINKTAADLAVEKKEIDIAEKQAEINRLQSVVDAATALEQAKADLTTLQAEAMEV